MSGVWGYNAITDEEADEAYDEWKDADDYEPIDDFEKEA